MLPAPIDSVLAALVRREPVDMPVAVVVAHADDETIGAGPLLHLFQHLLLVHVTDGAPRDLRDVRAAGFETSADYAAAREAELRQALRVGSVEARTVALGVPDQQASLGLSGLAGALAGVLSGVAVVFTHAYEGGHPDHDAVAFAVQATGRPTIEMAGYHAAPDGGPDGGIEVGRFLAGGAETVVALDPHERAVREGMLECFVTQRATLRPFLGAREQRFRPAPVYDFARPAAARVYYDGFDWGMTSDQWRRLASDALR